MKPQKLLNQLSSGLFLSAMFISKGANLKPPILGYLCFIGSLSIYLLAYILWQLAIVYTDPNDLTPPPTPSTVRLLFNLEYSLSACLGCFACCFALFSLLTPSSLCIAGWLFAFSNSFWFYGEYQVKQRFEATNPSQQEKEAQSHFFTYIQVAMCGSLLQAINLTLCYFDASFPLSNLGSLLFYVIAGANIWGLLELFTTAYINTKSTTKSEENTSSTNTILDNLNLEPASNTPKKKLGTNYEYLKNLRQEAQQDVCNSYTAIANFFFSGEQLTSLKKTPSAATEDHASIRNSI